MIWIQEKGELLVPCLRLTIYAETYDEALDYLLTALDFRAAEHAIA